jgi:hypothetical protein
MTSGHMLLKFPKSDIRCGPLGPPRRKVRWFGDAPAINAIANVDLSEEPLLGKSRMVRYESNTG